MKTPPWLLGPLLWDVARYLERLKLAQQFWEFYQDISVLQPAEAASPQNFTAAFDTLCEARSLALGENWQPANLNLAPQALKSIFSSIQMRAPASRNGNPERFYFSPQPLHDDPLRQLSRELADEALKAHFLKFIRELQALKRWNSHQKLDTLLPLIEKYGWCLAPWGLEKETDVPLFALAKMSAAIMACWSENGAEPTRIPAPEEEAYTLICGDISGIQKYIYRISSAKGAAKGLKARSFELAILSDAVAKYLLNELALPVTNLIYSSGGKFYILAPEMITSPKDQQRVACLKYIETVSSEDLAVRFWEHYQGELFLGLGAVKLSGKDFMTDNFGGKWQDVTKQCNVPKQTKFQTVMNSDYNKIFAPHGEGGDAITCDVCLRETTQDNPVRPDLDPQTGEKLRDICLECEKTEKRGKKLARVNLLAEVHVDKTAAENNVAKFKPLGLDLTYYLLTDSEECDLAGDEITYYNLNIEKYGGENFLMRKLEEEHINCAFRFYGGNELPCIENSDEPHNYDTLTEASTGIKRLGVLRMDVDFLGSIFAAGLQPLREGQPRNPAARVLALSWHLNYYFCGRVNDLRRQVASDHALIVYSGGDDLFIVGSWDKVVELAQRIRDDFQAYTDNKQLTISGGMVIVPKKFPIHKAAILSGKAEDEAKEIDGKIRRRHHALNARAVTPPQTPGDTESRKDGFTFLDKPLRWQDFKIAVSIKNALLTALTLEPATLRLDNGILTRLRQIYTLYETPQAALKKLLRAKEIDLLQYMELMSYNKWRWSLVYALSRYLKDHPQHEALIKNLQEALINNRWQPLKWENDQWQKEPVTLNEPVTSLDASQGVEIVSFIDVPTRWVELLIRKD